MISHIWFYIRTPLQIRETKLKRSKIHWGAQRPKYVPRECGWLWPNLAFRDEGGATMMNGAPPSIHANKPSLTMKLLVRPLGGGISRAVHPARQPDAPREGDFTRLPIANKNLSSIILTTRYGVHTLVTTKSNCC